MLKTELTGYEAATETQEKSGVFTPYAPKDFPWNRHRGLGRSSSNGRITKAAHYGAGPRARGDFQQSRRSFEGAKNFHESLQALAVELAKKFAVLAKRRTDNEPISKVEAGSNILRRHPGTNQHWHMRVFFHPPQYGQVRRLGS